MDGTGGPGAMDWRPIPYVPRHGSDAVAYWYPAAYVGRHRVRGDWC